MNMKPNMKRLSLLLLATLLLSACNTQYFPETRHIVHDPFLEFWNKHGGLRQFGYPLTEAFQAQPLLADQIYLVQYFERALFEYHPENKPPNDVQLAHLGRIQFASNYMFETAPVERSNRSNGRYFPETGNWLGGRFRTYWETHGGLAIYGLPISDELEEKSTLNGKIYTVQYFERAVFEYHPEYRGSANEVLLAQLGRYTLDFLYPRGEKDQPAIAGVSAPTVTATPRKSPDTDADGVPDVSDECPNQKENRNGIFNNNGCADTIDKLVKLAATDIDQYWRQDFTKRKPIYYPPTGPTLVRCVKPRACREDEVQTGLYDPQTHVLRLNATFLEDYVYIYGDYAAVNVVAHEWGHHIQSLLGRDKVSNFTPDYIIAKLELEADCLSGTYAAQSPYLEEKDFDEAQDAIEHLPGGDATHGTSEQRLAAITFGFAHSPDACFARYDRP
jgi:predicted metalloprotease